MSPSIWVIIKWIRYHAFKCLVSICRWADIFQAREWTISWHNHVVPKNAYIVIRIYNLDKETNPDFTAYVDPWAMYLARELNFLARENYSVTPKEQGNWKRWIEVLNEYSLDGSYSKFFVKYCFAIDRCSGDCYAEVSPFLFVLIRDTMSLFCCHSSNSISSSSIAKACGFKTVLPTLRMTTNPSFIEILSEPPLSPIIALRHRSCKHSPSSCQGRSLSKV